MHTPSSAPSPKSRLTKAEHVREPVDRENLKEQMRLVKHAEDVDAARNEEPDVVLKSDLENVTTAETSLFNAVEKKPGYARDNVSSVVDVLGKEVAIIVGEIEEEIGNYFGSNYGNILKAQTA